MTQSSIPNFYVYGEPVRTLDVGFVHVEMISDRKNMHRGKVAAHKHPQMGQITYWTKGGGRYHIEDTSWTFSAPAISFVPSGVVHGFSVRPSSDAMVVSIASDALDEVLEKNGAPLLGAIFLNQQVSKNDWHVIAMLMGLLDQEYGSLRDHHGPIISHLAGVVLGYISRQRSSADVLIPHQTELAQNLQRCVDLHFREKRKIHDYVVELNTSPHLLDKASKSAFGLPVKQLILKRRLLEAKRLLRFTIRSAEDISNELGFNDPAYFSREFKKHTGLSPGTWRSAQQGD